MTNIQEEADNEERMHQHVINQLNSLKTDSQGNIIKSSGNWHVRKCANLDELDESFDPEGYE